MNTMKCKFWNKRILLLIIGGVMLLSLTSCKHGEKADKSEPIKVSVITIDTVRSGMVRTYVGEIEERLSLSLSFAAGGKVEKVQVHEGDYVREGQLLVTVNTATARNAYNSAKAQLEQAEDAYRRLKIVYDQGSLAEVKWVEMLTNLEKARSLEQIAKKQLSDCELYAPASGVIGKCNARAGVGLLPGEPAVTLLDVSEVSVTFAVPESEISSLPLGRETSIIIPALNDMVLKGTVSEKSITSNPVAHSYQVKIALPNANRKLLPGMVCKVEVNQPNEMGFVIPANCVQTRPEGLSVWVVCDGKPERRIITTAEYVVNGVLVLDGLHQDDTLIVEGQQKLFTGAEITYN